jgi:glycosyltransferase involved in cell wall biosynthesis
MAVLEAMAAGLPVVATSVNGTPEAVEDGVTGYLVPPADASALAERLLAVASDDAHHRSEMGHAARHIAMSRFGADRMVDELLEVYRSSVRKTPRTR